MVKKQVKKVQIKRKVKTKTKRMPVMAPVTKKKRKKRKPVKRSEITIPDPDPQNLKYLRFLAAERYARDLNNPSIRELLQQEPFVGTAWSTWRDWADRDRWADRRKMFHDQIRDRAAEKLTEDLISARKRQHDQIGTILSHLTTAMFITPAKTKEGVAQALTKHIALQDDLRVKILEDAVHLNLSKRSSAPAATSTHPIKPLLSREDAKVAAEAVLRKRLKETRKRLAAGNPNADVDDG